MGDATDALIRLLDDTVSRAREQIRFDTRQRLPLTEFPVPPTTRSRSDDTCWARCSSRRAVLTPASSATSPAFTAASRA
jgi:hypothetical protein